MKNKVIEVQNVQISISKQKLDDYICITDIAKAKIGESRSSDVVKNWLRNRNTLEFLGTWEKIYNPDFKGSYCSIDDYSSILQQPLFMVIRVGTEPTVFSFH